MWSASYTYCWKDELDFHNILFGGFSPDDLWTVFYYTSSEKLFAHNNETGEKIQIDACDKPDGFTFSPNSQRVIYNSENKVISTPLDGSSLPITLCDSPGDTILVDPLSQWVVFYYTFSSQLLSVPITGTAPAVQLNPSGEVSEFLISSNGHYVVYRADGALFSIPIAGGVPPTALYAVCDNFMITPDGQWVVFRGYDAGSTQAEVFCVPITGSSSPVKLNSPLIPEGNVLAFSIRADSQCISYQADQETDEVPEIYSVPIAGGPVIKRSTSGDITDGPGLWAGARLVYKALEIYSGMGEFVSKGLYASTLYTGPTSTIQKTTGQSASTNTLPISFEVIFSEPPVGLEATHFVNDGTAYDVTFSLTELDTTHYRLEATAADGDGTIIPRLPAGVVMDAENEPNFESSGVETSVLLDRTPPVISFIGPNPQVIECHGELVLPEVQALDFVDGVVPVQLVANNVNAGVPGSYQVVYESSDLLGNTIQGALVVNVVDVEPPVVTLLGDSAIRLACKTPFTDPGVIVTDACAGNIGARVEGLCDTSEPGVYTLTYTADDGQGNTDAVQRSIEVYDEVPPIVTLRGPSSMTLLCGQVFFDPGASATDACAGDLPVAVEGQVTTSEPGIHTLTYMADDGHGNTDTAQRTVTVHCDCILNTARILYPVNTSIIRLTAQDISMTFQATVDCPEDTVSLQFFLDGAPLGEPFTQPPYDLSVTDLASSASGTPHTLSIEAEDAVGGLFTAESTFTLVSATAQPNGLPDVALNALFAQDGDAYFGAGILNECARSIRMQAFGLTSENDPVTIEITLPGDINSGAIITASREVLNDNELGVLIAVFGCDTPESVLDAVAENLGLIPGYLTPGGNYLYLDLLISSDDGQTFTPIDPVRLQTHPLQIELFGIEPQAGRATQLYMHAALLADSSWTITGATGDWSVASASCRRVTKTQSITTFTTSLIGLLAPFDVDPQGPCLHTVPSAQFDLILGLVPVGQTLETEILIENTGTGILEGTLQLDGDPQFTLTGFATYRLGPGQRTASGSLVLHYAPSTAEDNQAILHFINTGDGEPERTTADLTIHATGIPAANKTVSLFGCGVLPGSTVRGSFADFLLIGAMVFLLGLLWRNDGKGREFVG
ncbi:MAG TPA: DUF5011 domain-containing protein [Candidatus Hydrogenedentes bacterium]|nr:DUF5011 domain-containing protein [Candidatus Hydrogenedentota bacterium]